MHKIGDIVYFEDFNFEEDSFKILTGKIIEVNQEVSRKGVISNYYLTDIDNSWRSESEVFSNKKDLVEFALVESAEVEEHVVGNISALEGDLREEKRSLKDIKKRIGILKGMR